MTDDFDAKANLEQVLEDIRNRKPLSPSLLKAAEVAATKMYMDGDELVVREITAKELYKTETDER